MNLILEMILSEDIKKLLNNKEDMDNLYHAKTIENVLDVLKRYGYKGNHEDLERDIFEISEVSEISDCELDKAVGGKRRLTPIVLASALALTSNGFESPAKAKVTVSENVDNSVSNTFEEKITKAFKSAKEKIVKPDKENILSGGIGAILATLFTSLVFGKKVLSKNKTIKNLDQRLSETQNQFCELKANLTPNEYELEADEEEEKLKHKILGLAPKEQTLKELTWDDKCPPKTRPKGWADWYRARKAERTEEVAARKELSDQPAPNMCSAPSYIRNPRPVPPRNQKRIPDAVHTYKPLDNELTLPDQKPILEALEKSPPNFTTHQEQRTKTQLERQAKWEKNLDFYDPFDWKYLNSDEVHENLNSESPAATLPDYFKTDKMADIRVFLQKSTLETNAKSFTRMLMDATEFFRNKWIWHRENSVIPCTDDYSVRYIPDTLSQLANQGRIVTCIDYLQRWINDLESYLENCTCVYEAGKTLSADYYIGFFKEYLDFFSVVSEIFDSMPEVCKYLSKAQCKNHNGH